MHIHKILLLLNFMVLMTFSTSQELIEDSFTKISGLMDAYPENDGRAFTFVDLYISKAKNEKNKERLIKGYELAIFYSGNVDKKLIYADSAISSAVTHKNNDLISRAYLGKGIIYYYNRRQYKPALDQYIKAFQFSKNSKDFYLKNKIIYHLGIVKSYLGYYKEAAGHFVQSSNYFENKLATSDHLNIKLNNEKGYYNSIYRLSTCYKNLQQYKKEDSLIALGLVKLKRTNHHPLEFGYFQKGKGVQLLRERNSYDALQYLTTAQKILNDQQDYASLTTVYFYMGKMYSMRNETKKSLSYFNKVDSLLSKFWFVTPEIRSSYVYLINNAKTNENPEKQLYYMDQLLKVDSIINVDFAMLSSQIYRDYDSEKLVQDKNKTISQLTRNVGFSYVLIGVAVFTSLYLVWRFSSREKLLTKKYNKLLSRYELSKEGSELHSSIIINTPEKSYSYSKKSEEIKSNLKIFEEKKQFLAPNLTIVDVAKMIGCNRNHLSYILNDHLKLTFPMYLKTLRIEYITKQLMENRIYLSYKVDALAAECGIANRQLFSAQFLEMTGMRPADFIRKRKEDLEKSV